MTDDVRLKLYADICDKPEVRRYLEERIADETSSSNRIEASNRTVDRDRSRCVERLGRELPMEKAIGLGFPPSIDGNATIDAPEERVAAGVQLLLNRRGLDDASLQDQYASLIRQSCEESFGVREAPPSDGFYRKVLAAF